MQNPPPGPPPGQVPPPPPGYPQQPYQPAASGIDKKTGAFLAYLLWWVTGIIMLFVGRADPDVKYHAAQSVVFFGSVSVIRIILGVIGAFTAPFTIGAISNVIEVAAIVFWIYCLWKAWTSGGARFQIPFVGGVVTPYAEQLAASVN